VQSPTKIDLLPFLHRINSFKNGCGGGGNRLLLPSEGGSKMGVWVGVVVLKQRVCLQPNKWGGTIENKNNLGGKITWGFYPQLNASDSMYQEKGEKKKNMGEPQKHYVVGYSYYIPKKCAILMCNAKVHKIQKKSTKPTLGKHWGRGAGILQPVCV